MDLDSLTGAGGTLEVGGRLLSLKHLNAYDMGMLEAFFKERRERPMKRFLEEVQILAPLKASDPDAYREAFDRLLLQAHEEEKQGLDAGGLRSSMDGMEGVAYTLWLMARGNHPDLTFEWLKEAVCTADLSVLKKKVDFVNRAWMALEGGGDKGPLPTAPLPG
jgi:hypothetical protein